MIPLILPFVTILIQLDYNSNELHLWRDQIGIKPLYYCVQNDTFIFASEIKAIYSVLDRKPNISFSAVDDILRYRFVDDNSTVFEGIKKVMPGEHIFYNGRTLEKEPYWELQRNAPHVEKTEREKQAEVEEFRELFEMVINQNLKSDTKGGFFTSGGLDSSLTTAASFQLGSRNFVQPISLKFMPKPVIDEQYGAMLEKYFNKDFEWAELSDEVARETLLKVTRFQDEPLENPTHVGSYLMAERARELGIKVVITGDGSDEFFLGYERQACWELYNDAKERYPSLNWTTSVADANFLYNNLAKDILRDKKYTAEQAQNMDEALIYERGFRLPEYHANRLDRMTMAHSIEARVPWVKRFADVAALVFGYIQYRLYRHEPVTANLLHFNVHQMAYFRQCGCVVIAGLEIVAVPREKGYNEGDFLYAWYSRN